MSLYDNALRARRRGARPSGEETELGMLIQAAMLCWKRLENAEAAEEHFRRVRKIDPTNEAMLGFYRAYYPERGETAKLLQVLRQAQKSIGPSAAGDAAETRRALSVEIAQLAEDELENPEKAIDAWKAILRRDPRADRPRTALERLYRKTGKWNALLDLIKDDLERIDAGDHPARIAKLLEVVEIYRDRLKLSAMVINTYNSILAIEPEHPVALDALAEKYEQVGRWNDLITILGKKAAAAATADEDRVVIWRRVAALWTDRFGNFAQAARPLEKILELVPGDREAISKLKDIYGRRRQWRALIDLMGREVAALAPEMRRDHLLAMAKLAGDRLGDGHLAIELYNQVLEPSDGESAAAWDPVALAALAALYDREKRYLALAEIYHRQAALCGDDKKAKVSILERLGALAADRLRSPELAASAYREILDIQPRSLRATRMLRELYSGVKNYDALESLYGELGQWDELCEAFFAIADRADDRAIKIDVLSRAAAAAAAHSPSPDRVARAYERLLAADPQNLDAARALVPIYQKREKWARLLAAYEILLEHEPDQAKKLALHVDIRELCEKRLGSKTLAFQWAARAYELSPDDGRLIADLERLGAEADAWDEVAAVLDRRVQSADVSKDEKVRLFRELGKIAATRLHRPDAARAYQNQVLEILPDDRKAMAALEDLATQQEKWPDLLRVYRRRADLEENNDAKLDLLFKIAFIEEDRVRDLDAAAATYRRILEIDPDSRRALKTLAKMHESRGDSAGLAEVLERELTLAPDAGARVPLLLRLGGLYEGDLARPIDALAAYEQALSLSPTRREVHTALERFLDGDRAGMDADTRVRVAGLLLGVYEQTEDFASMARAIEVLREHAGAEADRIDFDRRLVRLYGAKLERHGSAFVAALRVFAARPDDAENRGELLRLAPLCDRVADLADALEAALGGGAGDEKAPELDLTCRQSIATEVAVLLGHHLHREAEAERAWQRVLAIDPASQPAYDALDGIFRAGDRWSDLRDLLGAREANAASAEAKKAILLAICDLDEGVLADPADAIVAYRRVLEIDPGMLACYKALERLYEAAGEWSELEDILSREGDCVGEGEDTALFCWRAELRADRLGDAQGAVDLLEEVIAREPASPRARALLDKLFAGSDQRLRVARILEPLYEADGLWEPLAATLKVQAEAASNGYEKVALLVRVATVEEERLGRTDSALATWREALCAEPSDERPRQAVRRLCAAVTDIEARRARWRDTAAAYERACKATTEPVLLCELLGELAAIYDELSETDRAEATYHRLLDADPTNSLIVREASMALAAIYESGGRWKQLAAILRRLADHVDSTSERVDVLVRAATVLDERGGDADLALSAWREVLAEDPDEPRALDALERLFSAAGRDLDLLDILRRRVEIAADPEAKKSALGSIATLCEQALSDPGEAIASYLEILDFLPDDISTLESLSRLYEQEKRPVDLAEIMVRRLDLTTDTGDRLALSFALGELLSGQLGRDSEAIERYAEVLRQAPDHPGAIAAVERYIHGDYMQRAARILEPLYEDAERWDKLVELLALRAEAASDSRERQGLLRRVASICERYLGDAPRAFTVYARATREATAEPELPELIEQLERLAAAQGKEGDLIDIYVDLAPDVLDGELQRRLYLDIADLARAVRQDPVMAREYYQRVLDVQPDDIRALNALEHIYREAQSWNELRDILTRRAELAGADPDARAAALAEAARLSGEVLSRPEEATEAWEQVLDLQPENREAARALEKLYEASERWHDLTELSERRLGFVTTINEAVELRFRLGEIYEQKLHDPDRAVESYSAALGGDPSHTGATAALERFFDDAGARGNVAEVLEPIYVSRQDWPKLVRIYEIKLEAAGDPSERLRLTRYIARLYEDQLEDLEGAFRWYGRVFHENPGDGAIRDQLVRLATILESWESLANVYQEVLDDDPSETPETREVALALADICDRRLGEVERALAAYRRVLAASPDDHATFARVETMLTRAERWFALVDLYEEAVASAADDPRRIGLLLRAARVYEDHLRDPRRAIDSLRQVLEIDPADAAADELERLYESLEQHYDLSELLLNRIAGAADTAGAARFRLKLASLLEDRMHDVAGAIDHYEQALTEPTSREAALSALERLILDEDHRERITHLLEPVYRDNDWWQKLVVILDARLEYIADPETRVAMLREIAHLHESRGGDPTLALAALSRAWRDDIRSDDVYEDLVELSAKLDAWDQLVATLDDGIAGEYDVDLVARILARIAGIHETYREDRSAAIATWRRILEVQEDHEDALVALDRLYAEARDHERLVEIVGRRAELAASDGDRREFLHRVAVLASESLGRPKDAITAFKSVLAIDDADGVALDGLERLYAEEGEHAELAGILARKIELCEDPAARRALRLEVARVRDVELGDSYEAIAELRAVIDDDPDDPEALAALCELYRRESMWPELVEALDARAQLATEVDGRAELSFEAARVVEGELADAETAIGRYQSVLELVPAHAGARDALDALTRAEGTLESAAQVLEALYRDEGAHDLLAALYERLLAAPWQDPKIRGERFAALANLHEQARNDLPAAFAVWARALAESPEDDDVLARLENIAATRGMWRELAQVFEDRLADIVDAPLEHAYATRLGRVYEEALGDLDRAAAAYRRALDAAPDDIANLTRLAAIFERSNRARDLAEILARQADVTLDEADKADVLFRLGDVRERSLEDVPGAVTAYRDVLEGAPQHPAARAALERLMTHEGQRADIIAILEPLYEEDGDFASLVELGSAKLTITTDHLDRALIYSRLAELCEHQLGDPVRALDAAGGWLAEDPQSEQALSEVERLAALSGRWSEVCARLEGIVAATDVDDIKRPLLLRLGRAQLEELSDDAAAETALRGALAIDGESAEALAGLERIYRAREDGAELARILARQAELAFDSRDKRRLIAEVGTLLRGLGDDAGALDAWTQVLEIDEGDGDAHANLAAIHEAREDWHALVDVLEIAARFAGEARAEAAIRARIARLQSQRLEDLDAASLSWQAVTDLDPQSDEALAELEAVHAAREDWLAVQEVLNRRLDLAADDATRITMLQRLAHVAENRRESLDEAAGYLHQILDIDGAHLATCTELARILALGERWHELCELHERIAEVHAAAGRGDLEIGQLACAADIWEGPLDSPDAAAEMLEKILTREPRYVPALTRLGRIYEASEDWERAGEVLSRALSLGPTGQDAADLHFRLGEVARNQSGDEDRALASYMEALRHDPVHAGAVRATEAIARERGDHALCADMIARRESSIEDPGERVEVLIELAAVYTDKLGRPDLATSALERALALVPDEPRVCAPLADAYFAAGRYDDAAPIFETLATAAKKARRMKDVAKYRQRLGGILEARGDVDGALSAYEEAFRVNPTDVETMAGLGRLHMGRQDWEKARRVYRSLVLQNIDPRCGLTKAEVYHHLGSIHIKLGEAKKARGMFQRGLELEPQNAALREALETL
ncbi:MAG TPA: tetratricopeptide repeat protein [Kofleriaceae bacterium]|nr:tetratricopeptide repeat protein [Kofleriaceae bacterium]